MHKAIRLHDYINVICADFEPMRQFYEGILGFPLHSELGPSWVELRIGAAILALRPRPAVCIAGARGGNGESPTVVTRRHRRGRHESCRTGGVEVSIQAPPTDQVWGHRTLYFADPEYNPIEISASI